MMATMEASAPPRTVSGTAFAVGFVGAALALVAFIVLAAPRLQDQAAGLLGDDEQVLQVGRLGGVEWTATAVSGARGTCLVVELDGRRSSETCLDPADGRMGAVAVAAPGSAEAGYLLTGITAADVPQVRVELDSGLPPLPRVYRPRGFPAGFYATTVAPGVAVERVVGLDLDERELATRGCDGGPLATAEGAGCQSGGQG